jgi:hypothetical protein
VAQGYGEPFVRQGGVGYRNTVVGRWNGASLSGELLSEQRDLARILCHDLFSPVFNERAGEHDEHVGEPFSRDSHHGVTRKFTFLRPVLGVPLQRVVLTEPSL